MEDIKISKIELSFSDNLAMCSLNDFSGSLGLSVRACNVCNQNSILTLKDLLTFYSNERGFLNLKNCGRKTAQELEAVCQLLLSKLGGSIVENISLNNEDIPPSWVREVAPSVLSTIQLELINVHINKLFGELSVRTQNALSQLFGGRVDYQTLHHYFFEKKIQRQPIKNVGNKSFQEIELLIDKLCELVDDIKSRSTEEVEIKLFSSQLCVAFSLSNEFVESYISRFEDKKLPFFRFLDELIQNQYLFDKRRTLICQSRLGWFKSMDIIDLEKIGNDLGLSRERVRQISKLVEAEFLEKIKLLKTQENILPQFKFNYNSLDLSKDIIFVRQQFADEINYLEGTDFTPKFFTLVFSVLYSDSYILLGDKIDLFENHYLIQKDLINELEFDKFIAEVEKFTRERVLSDISLELDGFILRFFKKSPEMATFERIKNICLDLLMLEFYDKIRLELPNELVICRNTKQFAWEYAFEALEALGKPSKLDSIFQAILERHPDFDASQEGLRSIILRERSHFISFSRTSTYGLAKWEDELIGVRGGTIRDIAEEYLRKYDYPKHCYEITEFILQYRPGTSIKNVHTNLQYDESGRFRDFSAGFWGLSEFQYPDFRVNPVSNHTFTYFKQWLAQNPACSKEEAINKLSEKLNVQPVQIRAWLEEKLRNGILHLENDMIRIVQ